MKIKPIPIAKILEIVEGELHSGNPAELITEISNASDSEIVFLFNKSSAGIKTKCLVVRASSTLPAAKNVIVVKNPRLALAKFLNFITEDENSVSNTAEIAADVSIGPNVFIGPNVKIASGCVIAANSVIMSQVALAENVIIKPNVTIYPKTKIAANVILHAGVVLGCDGFGYEQLGDKSWYKIPHIGGLLIGRDVEIGAGTTVDRGTIGNTIIHAGVKIDNQCQIGHNVVIGENTIIAGCCGIAGSAVIGSGVILGGRVSVANHVQIVSGVVIKGSGNVIQSLTKPGVYGGAMQVLPGNLWNRCMVLIKSLPKFHKILKKLEN